MEATMEWTKLILTSLGGGIALFVGIGQYVLTSSLAVRQPFLQKQTELCLAASEQHSAIGNDTGQRSVEKIVGRILDAILGTSCCC